MEKARSPETDEPLDPDIDLHVPAQRDELQRQHGAVLAVVALGGALGAGARYGASQLWPTAAAGFPWTLLWINVVGCAAIGVLMAALSKTRRVHPLLRPFLGTGFLGGFTTLSAYAADIHLLIGDGRPQAAVAYLTATLLLALAAVWVSAWGTRRALAWTRGLADGGSRQGARRPAPAGHTGRDRTPAGRRTR